jgi:hypothetical protein
VNLRRLASRLPKNSQNEDVRALVASLATIFRQVTEADITSLPYFPSVMDPVYGATGSGTVDDAPSIRAAITANAGKTIFFPDPPVAYKISSSLGTIPANTRLIGLNKRTTKITKAFNGLVATLADGVCITNLYFEGDGANYTGDCFEITGTDGNQILEQVRLLNFDGPCVEFTATTAGSRSSFSDVEATRTNAGTTTGRYAFVIADGVQAAAVPRAFDHIQTGGNCAFTFGGANDLFITNSFLGDLAFSDNSRSVHIATTRVANQVALTIKGANHSIVGGDILAAITLGANLATSVIGPCSLNNPPITDNSGLATNLVYQPVASYTPTFTAAGGSPALGNGTHTGSYARSGSLITFEQTLVVGGTTNLGTGALSFTLPVARISGGTFEVTVKAFINGANYTGVGQIVGGGTAVSPIRDTSGSFTATSPATPVATDTYIISGTYTI